MISLDEQIALDQKHLACPKIGDYWHEMYCPCFVVINRAKNILTICTKTKTVDPYHWTWDLDQLEKIDLQAFARRLRYGGKTMGDKTWCHVEPKAHKWAAERRLRG